MPRPDPFPQPPVLDFDGYRLRPFSVTDAALLSEATRDADVTRWTAMPADLDLPAAADWILAVHDRMDAGGDLILEAIVDEWDRMCGGIGIGDFDWRSDSGEIFYWLLPGARGRGVATGAVRRLSRWAFDTLGLIRLELTTHPDNAASQRVAERAGFRREGLLRSKRMVRGMPWDLVLYARLPADPDGPETKAALSTWIYFIHPPRDDFAATMTDEEKSVWEVHWERLKRLYAAGQVILVGPTLGRANTGICVFEAPDEAAARRFMDEDPTISGGYATGELRPFHVSLLRGRA